MGVVGVLDETAFTKKGRHSAGVARQHNGRLGKEDNCQRPGFRSAGRWGTSPSGSTTSNAGAETPLETLSLVACTRCRVEEFFEDCKSYLGKAQYETRSWVGRHHHMTLVVLAHLFVTV